VFTPASQFDLSGLGLSALSGLGQDLSQVLTSGGIQTGTAIGGALASHAIGTATTGAVIGAGLASAGIALAGVAIMSWLSARRDNAMDKTNASRVADEAERLLQQNLTAWNASRKTVEDRDLAYSNAATVMQWMASPQGCGNPALEDPGRRCISERLTEGARYPWKVWYVDPITSYTPTVSASASNATASSSAPTTAGMQTPGAGSGFLPGADGVTSAAGAGTAIAGGLPPWALPAAAAAFALFLFMKGGR
jgi:hypothetical protein